MATPIDTIRAQRALTRGVVYVHDAARAFCKPLEWALSGVLDYELVLDWTPQPIAPLNDPYAQWAEESCRITAEPDFYPHGHKIGRAYVDAELPVAESRLRIAGRRLAEVLNLALAP